MAVVVEVMLMAMMRKDDMMIGEKDELKKSNEM